MVLQKDLVRDRLSAREKFMVTHADGQTLGHCEYLDHDDRMLQVRSPHGELLIPWTSIKSIALEPEKAPSDARRRKTADGACRPSDDAEVAEPPTRYKGEPSDG